MFSSLRNLLLVSCVLLASAQGPRMCPAPPEAPPNARLDDKFIGKQSFSSGEKVYYHCAKDSTPSRGLRSVLCERGRWRPVTLKCEKKSCGYAGDILNGQLDYEENTFIGSKANATCKEGYVLKGPSYLICKETGWTGPLPTCEESDATCPTPAVSNSVNSNRDASVFRVGESVAFACSPGFQLDGAQQVTCGPGGQWQPELPQCKILPEKTQAVVTRQEEVTCPAPAVSNSMNSNRGVFQVGESVAFACRPGFQLDGAQQVTCGPGGQWQPGLPQCKVLPEKTQAVVPRPGGCGVPLSRRDSNADLADIYFGKTSFSSGEKVYYVCNVGYSPAGGSRARTCRNGQWTPLRMKCERMLCGSAGDILNGYFIYTGVQFGNTATAVCNEGYTLVGQETRTCMSKGWDGRSPACEAVTCEDPPKGTNAQIINSNQRETYSYMEVVQYQCREGTLVGPKEIWCTKDGTWSAPPPTCQVHTCEPPHVPGGSWAQAHLRKYQPRDTLWIQCFPGYTLNGPGSITCGPNGQWTPSLPRCMRMHRHIQRDWRRPHVG